jgi:hypothetical protein
MIPVVPDQGSLFRGSDASVLSRKDFWGVPEPARSGFGLGVTGGPYAVRRQGGTSLVVSAPGTAPLQVPVASASPPPKPWSCGGSGGPALAEIIGRITHRVTRENRSSCVLCLPMALASLPMTIRNPSAGSRCHFSPAQISPKARGQRSDAAYQIPSTLASPSRVALRATSGRPAVPTGRRVC